MNKSKQQHDGNANNKTKPNQRRVGLTNKRSYENRSDPGRTKKNENTEISKIFESLKKMINTKNTIITINKKYTPGGKLK